MGALEKAARTELAAVAVRAAQEQGAEELARHMPAAGKTSPVAQAAVNVARKVVRTRIVHFGTPLTTQRLP